MLFLAVSIAWACSCGEVETLKQPAGTLRSLRDVVECPHDWTPVVHLVRGDTNENTFTLPGRTTNVVEYHDCQRMADPKQGGYGPLLAIFASATLSTLDSQLTAARRGAGASSAAVSDVAIAAALIVDFDAQPYPSLGIGDGFNCLYLYFGTTADGGAGYKARMKPFPGATKDPGCAAPVDPSTLPTTPELDVHELATPSTDLTSNDIPPVARWDFDRSAGEETAFIGIKCGAKWCEIGPKGFTPSDPHAPLQGAAAKEKRRVLEVKGWHDHQRLAVYNPAGKPVPSSLGAYVIPAPNLGSLELPAFSTQWAPVATIEMDGPPGIYKKKLGLARPSPTATTQMYVCNADWNACLAKAVAPGGPASGNTSVFVQPPCKSGTNDLKWWALMVNIDMTVSFRCVNRRDHSGLGITIPGTARWRWVDKDETIWVRCANGCCEVDQTQA